MPQDASQLGETPLLRALFLAEPKVGKTTTTILSAAKNFGSGYVICCSTREHLRTAQILSKDLPPWQFDVVKGPQDMEEAIKTARKGVREDKYKWVLVDDFNVYAYAVEQAAESENKGGYKTYQQYRQILTSALLRLFDMKCHVMCTMHYYEVGESLIEGQTPKRGKGIVPCLSGRARAEVPGLFNQVIWMQKEKTGQRVFCLNPEGVWGIGSQGLPPGTKEIEADLGKLVDALKSAACASEAK